jgi:hypothetical protein
VFAWKIMPARRAVKELPVTLARSSFDRAMPKPSGSSGLQAVELIEIPPYHYGSVREAA